MTPTGRNTYAVLCDLARLMVEDIGQEKTVQIFERLRKSYEDDTIDRVEDTVMDVMDRLVGWGEGL